jgi:hypothetical protein
MSGIVRSNNAGQSGIASNANTIDSDDYVDASIDAAHMSDESIDSDQYVDGSIDTIHIGNDQVTGAKLNPSLVLGDIIYADGTDTITRLAKGSANEVLTMGGSNAPTWAAASSGAVAREGGSLLGEGGDDGSGGDFDAGVEASTTSTSAVDLLGASSLTIAGAQPAKLVVNGRKTSGAASAGGYGLKLNTTTVQEAVSSVSNGIGGFSGANEVQEVSIVGDLRPRVTNYTIGKYVGVIGAYNASGGALGTGFAPGGSPTAAYPTAEITAVLIRGITASGSQTVSADELNIYSFATS